MRFTDHRTHDHETEQNVNYYVKAITNNKRRGALKSSISCNTADKRKLTHLTGPRGTVGLKIKHRIKIDRIDRNAENKVINSLVEVRNTNIVFSSVTRCKFRLYSLISPRRLEASRCDNYYIKFERYLITRKILKCYVLTTRFLRRYD